MPTKMPLPTRKSDKTLYFSDYPEFKPNLTPKEIFQMGSFGGTYYRQYIQLKIIESIQVHTKNLKNMVGLMV